MSRNLIYLSVFLNKNYIKLLKLFVESLVLKGSFNPDTTDLLIMTQSGFEADILEAVQPIVPILYILESKSIFAACCSRLQIFEYASINLYNKILYLDTDILINGDINILFNINIDSNKLYALEEGSINNLPHGSQFFDPAKIDITTSAFTSGILYFRNSTEIRRLYNEIILHIIHHVRNRIPIPACQDQPFIVYHAISKNKYDNQLMKQYAKNNPSEVSDTIIIYHFPGGIGNYDRKDAKMTAFLEKIHAFVGAVAI